MEMEFLVATKDLKGLPGLSKGDVVMVVGTEIIECYEYDVYEIVLGPLSRRRAKVRAEHRQDLMRVTVDGASRKEITEKVQAVSDGITGGDVQ